jgi:membrane-anchored protein YejM (alkaline phosphatase superfamily)
LSEWSIDWKLVAAGNFILFLVSLFSYYLHFKALTTANNHAFLRFVYSAFIGKFFLILAFVVVYALAAGKASNRYGLFACLGLYIVYTFIETTALMKMNKRKNA